MFKLSVTSEIDITGHLGRIKDDKFWKFAAIEWHKLYTPYVPMQSGNLYRLVEYNSGEIIHKAPYSMNQYKNNNNPSKSKHPKASKEWDKAAETTEKPKLIQSMQSYVDSGRLKL